MSRLPDEAQMMNQKRTAKKAKMGKKSKKRVLPFLFFLPFLLSSSDLKIGRLIERLGFSNKFS
jgi:hypothetical protein